MRRLVYTVAVGESRPLWERCIASVQAYCQRHGIEHRVQREPILRIAPKASQRSASALKLGYLPIFEKLNAFPLLTHYAEIACLDADVYAMPDAGSIFDAVPAGAEYAAVVERDLPITAAYARKLDSYTQAQYGRSDFRFRNCGVEVLRPSLLRLWNNQSPSEFIHRPEFARYVNGEGAFRWQTEQTLKNVWLVTSGARVHDLAPCWNVLYGAVKSMQGAQLVHFFLSDHLNSDDPEEMLRTGTARARV